MNETAATAQWSPDSWRCRETAQQPAYGDADALAAALRELAALPPIVTSWEVESLRESIATAQRGEAFVLQGGDCAETFQECSSDIIVARLKVLLQMSLVLSYGLRKPVIRIGRMAGQYAKPRSAPLESRQEVSLPSFRGDLVNRQSFTSGDREPDPKLLLRGYERAALTLNFIRSLVDGGFADLHHTENWNLDWVGHSPQAEAYEAIVDRITRSLDFIEHSTGRDLSRLRRTNFYTSHEGLLLSYEQAQTRLLQHRGLWYNLCTHFPWIGMRTAQLDGGHVEYFRGVANPMGIKIGPAMTPEWLLQLLTVLNPNNQPGRITLIHRMGAGRVEEVLPPLIEAVQREGARVLWMCDPMHGNTETAANGRKTRRLERIEEELGQAFAAHAQAGTWLGGVHLELTGENVTECVGGARGLGESDLDKSYRTQVDPRLNYEQAMELAMLISQQASR
ncbi:class II 3-deoxy-7-phosphoheptulonate synthase [Candidatus Foliamicus sp.]